MTTLIKAMNYVHNDDDNNNKNVSSNIIMIPSVVCCWWLPATTLVSKCVVRTENLYYLLLNTKLALNAGSPQARTSASTK